MDKCNRCGLSIPSNMGHSCDGDLLRTTKSGDTVGEPLNQEHIDYLAGSKSAAEIHAVTKPISDVDTSAVKDPSHYADSYPGDIEVYAMIKLLLNEQDLSDLTPYQIYQLGNVFKYRLRAGFKEDGGEPIGTVDLKKAMRCREMLDE